MPRVDTDDFYRTALAEHGETAQGVHWNSTASQQLRFQILRQLLPTDLGSFTLVDVGCGFGDFYCYLEQRGEPPRKYIGLDIMEPMVATARVRTGCDIFVRDVLTDSLPEADYYVCSGAMNTLTRKETRLFIKHCFAAARSAFIFNLLKGRNTSFTYNFYQPIEVVHIAHELGAECRIEEGYMSEDFTAIFVKKPE